MKECFKCNEIKTLSCFYRHKGMADGHVNKCKECNKKDVRDNRASKADYYRSYDRVRGNRQPDGYQESYRKEYPNKYIAKQMVNNAIRDGHLFRQPCEACGSEKYIHAHHDDYAKPLNVRWLCAAHHRQWHVANGESPNGQ